jgi:hypothetical protein
MEPKHFNLLTVAAVVSLIAAGVVHGAYNDWTSEKVSGQKLFASLDRDASQVGSVQIQKGKAEITLTKTGNGWAIAERANYPVRPEEVRKLLVALARAELVEPKTRIEAKYALLDLEDPAKDDTKATLVSLRDTEGKPIAEVVLGKSKLAAFGSSRTGTYIRRPGQPQTWLVNQDLRAPTAVSSWANPLFFQIDPKTVKSLSIAAPQAKPYLIVVEDAEKETFKFASIPAGEKLQRGISASSMVTAMKTLELLDVRKIDELPTGEKVHEAMLETAAGMKIDMRLRADDTDRWISLKVVEDGESPEIAKAIREKTDGWEFKVADWRARQTFKSPDELFEEDEKAKPAETEEKPADAPGSAPDPASGPASEPKQP